MDTFRVGRNQLLMLLLTTGLVLSVVPVYSVSGKACSHGFSVMLSPASESVTKGSNFRFSIIPTGPTCLTGTMVEVRASISPSANGLSWSTNTYHMPLYDTPYILGSTTLNTPSGSFTVTATLVGTQAPLVGVSESGTATLTVG